jgi:hypothetical protein
LLAATWIGFQVAANELSMTDPEAAADPEADAAEPEADPEAEAEAEEVELLAPLTIDLTQKSWFPESMEQTAFRRGLTTYKTSYNSRT